MAFVSDSDAHCGDAAYAQRLQRERSAAERDGITLVAVTLNAPDDWRDHERLYEYGFKQVEKSPRISGVRLISPAVILGL